jgi:hypothetical protein
MNPKIGVIGRSGSFWYIYKLSANYNSLHTGNVVRTVFSAVIIQHQKAENVTWPAQLRQLVGFCLGFFEWIFRPILIGYRGIPTSSLDWHHSLPFPPNPMIEKDNASWIRVPCPWHSRGFRKTGPRFSPHKITSGRAKKSTNPYLIC